MEPTPPQLMPSQPQHFSVRRYNHRSHRGEGGGPVEMTKEHSHSENSESSIAGERRGGGEMRRATLDCNLASLCDHIQLEGFNSGVFSDVVLNAMGSTYHLHRLILSRSSYFRNMLQGPWKEANAPVLTLNVDDKNVNGEAMEIALAYLYGHYPKLNDTNAFRVLAAASFLDLQDLCVICTDFIIAELWSANFLTYQVFAESQDYGSHGERVRNACWGYLCQSGAQELKEVLPKLSSQTLLALLTSDELWVPNEEKRLELALYTLLAKGTLCKEHLEQDSVGSEVIASTDSSSVNQKYAGEESTNDLLETEKGRRKSKDDVEGRYTARKILVELADSIVDSHSHVDNFGGAQALYGESNLESTYDCNGHGPSSSNTLYADDISASCSYLTIRQSGLPISGLESEGPSDEDPCCQLNSSWPPGNQMHGMSMNSSCNMLMPNEWERCNMSPLTWGGRTVARREVKRCLKRHYGMSREDYDSFVNVFEGGSLLYCNMSFEALLNARKHLEEMGFPCKALNDGLWLQMLLSQRVQEIGADTCRNCCRMSIACMCRQPFGYSTGVTAPGYYMQDHEHSNLPLNELGHVYINSSAQGERNGLFRPVRVHDRGPIDGLAGIGRGTTFAPAAAWPPTRYVFSRVPFGIGNRNSQQVPANDGPDNRPDSNTDLAGDGLTVLVGLSMGSNDITNVHEVQVGREFETGQQRRQVGSLTPGSTTSSIPVQMIDSPEHAMGVEWENANSSISLDLKTPLNHFPPFRFAVEFQDVHRLCDGQVKHSPEAFYAGSLWKVSVQAFSDEDPQGRRTLGMFLHRRKADTSDPLRKVHMYVDSREKVTARYQLICPSKREVMVFGSDKQTGTLLPKAPKGWGWRTALVFDELGDLLQNGTLRVAAVVQLSDSF